MIKYTLEDSEFIGINLFELYAGNVLDRNLCNANVQAFFDNMVKKGKCVLEGDNYKASEQFINRVNIMKSFVRNNGTA